MRDFNGNEVARVYSDQWGIYNGLYFSTWAVNPPNPTGYAPQMSIACMNDPGPIPTAIRSTTRGQIDRPIPPYNPAYSNFCYETPFMPGFTAYMDTPVIPTQAFADGYNLPDTRVSGRHAGDHEGRQQRRIGAARSVGPAGHHGGAGQRNVHGLRRQPLPDLHLRESLDRSRSLMATVSCTNQRHRRPELQLRRRAALATAASPRYIRSNIDGADGQPATRRAARAPA